MNEKNFGTKLELSNTIVLTKQFAQREKKGSGSGKHNRMDGLYWQCIGDDDVLFDSVNI